MKMERLEDEAREKQKELDKTRQQLLRVSGRQKIFPVSHPLALGTVMIILRFLTSGQGGD